MFDVQNHSKAFAIMLQRATQILYHLDQCKSLHAQSIAQFSSYIQKEPKPPTSLRAWSPLVSGLIVELSGALATIRVMQNDTWHLISTMSGARDAPSSIADAYKAFVSKSGKEPPKWLRTIDMRTKDIIVNYWETSGSQLANYRDLDQHFDVLARGSIFFPNKVDQSTLTIQLPDNPQEKSPSRFTYTKGVDAINVVMTGFTQLHDLIESIAKNQRAKPQPIGQRFDFEPPLIHQQDISTLTAILLYDVDGKFGIVIGQNEEMHVTTRFINL